MAETIKTTLSGDELSPILSKLGTANGTFNAVYTGETTRRQPIHTVYGGAHLFKSDSIPKLGAVAVATLQEYAPDFVSFATVLALPGFENLPTDKAGIEEAHKALAADSEALRKNNPTVWLAATVYERVIAKLKNEAVEDFRIDFEDGFGVRSNEEEDATAEQAALETAKGLKEGTLSPYIGIRIKMFSEELKARAVRTLDIFLSTLVKASGGKLPQNFVVTLPKVQIAEQITALVDIFEILEKKLGLPANSLKMEFMVETTQSVIGPDGKAAIPGFAKAARGRCTGAHFGTYDYTASASITAAYQTMDHPSCDFARHVMKVSLAGTGIWLSDGATNIMPVGPHRAAKDGPALSHEQIMENRKAVHYAWKLAYDHTRHSLKHAYYQGWDLHPAQFAVRYAASYTYFLEGFTEASDRLRNFIEKAAKATLTNSVFDDAATGQGLLNYFLRALNCGAITETEVQKTGLTLEEIRLRSFQKIIDRRAGRS